MKTIYRISAIAGLCLMLSGATGCGQGSHEGATEASATSIEFVDFKKQFEEAQQRAEEELLQQQALQQRRRGLVDVDFHGFDDQGRVVVSLSNRTGKPIDDIRGGIMAEDIDGNPLASSGLTIASPGVFLDVDASLNHAPFMSPRPQLNERLEAAPESVRFSFEAEEITYLDGTTESGLDP